MDEPFEKSGFTKIKRFLYTKTKKNKKSEHKKKSSWNNSGGFFMFNIVEYGYFLTSSSAIPYNDTFPRSIQCRWLVYIVLPMLPFLRPYDVGWSL